MKQLSLKKGIAIAEPGNYTGSATAKRPPEATKNASPSWKRKLKGEGVVILMCGQNSSNLQDSWFLIHEKDECC